MVHDAVSLHRERVLSMESFARAIERVGGASEERAAAPGENPFHGLDQLPTIKEAVEQLVEEALARGGGNQTIAARLLGITQSALSKRLKSARET
jgi:DNA-binding NtrC family response regulator